MMESDARTIINKLLLHNALTDGALEQMLDDPEYYLDQNLDDDANFIGDFNCTDALGNTGDYHLIISLLFAHIREGIDKALHLAARQGHTTDVTALCARPVDLDVHNKNGDTPLHIALKEIIDAGKRFDIINELLSCGAESTKMMPGGLTPLEYAESRFPLEKELHEIIANPPHDEDDDDVELEEKRKQAYDRSDLAFVDKREGSVSEE